MARIVERGPIAVDALTWLAQPRGTVAMQEFLHQWGDIWLPQGLVEIAHPAGAGVGGTIQILPAGRMIVDLARALRDKDG
jgi:hypothetical protein